MIFDERFFSYSVNDLVIKNFYWSEIWVDIKFKIGIYITQSPPLIKKKKTNLIIKRVG